MARFRDLTTPGRRIVWCVTTTTDLRPTAEAERRSEATQRTGLLPIGWALFAALVGPAVAAVCLVLEPPPANPNAPEPLVGTILGVALMICWAGAAVTAAGRRMSALSWANVVGGLSMAMTISCPLSGHHTSIGMWWVGQFVLCGAAWAAAAVGTFMVRRAR